MSIKCQGKTRIMAHGNSSSANLERWQLPIPMRARSKITGGAMKGFKPCWRTGLLWTSSVMLVALLLQTEVSLGAPAVSGKARDRPRFVDRLAPASTILVSVSADEVSALAQALPFQFANVTLPVRLHLISKYFFLAQGKAKEHGMEAVGFLGVLLVGTTPCPHRPRRLRLHSCPGFTA